MSQLILMLLTLGLETPDCMHGVLAAVRNREESRTAEGGLAAQEKPTPPPGRPAPGPAQEEKGRAKKVGETAGRAAEEGADGEDRAARAAVVAASEPAEAEPSFFERWVQQGKIKGRAGLRYETRRFRSRAFESVPRRTERDQEFRSYLEVETHGLGHEKLHSYVHMEWDRDIDGTRDPSFHKSLVTSYRPHGLYLLHSAYLEAREVWDRVQIRVGRQQVMEVHPVNFDGGSARMDDFLVLGMPAEVRVFGGAMVSKFTNLRQEGVFGGGLTLRPAEALDVEFRDTRYQDNRFEAEARWRPCRFGSVLGMYGMLNDRSRDARLEGEARLDGLDLTVTAGWYRLFNADFRLDYLTGQTSRRLEERFFLLPQLEPFQEFYVRLDKDLAGWLTLGGEFLDHSLRNRFNQSLYDTAYRELAGHLDLRMGPGSLRSEVRYYHADRRRVPVVKPRFPQAPVFTEAKVGETDHLAVHLNGSVELGKPGWGLDAGIVWHRVNYSDVYASADHETAIDYLVQLRARLTERASFIMRYELSRDMGYFSPYFDRFHALSWMLDVTL